MGFYFITSESVTEGHPDKVADRISDTILDSILELDSTAKVAVETLVTTDKVFVVGETSLNGNVDLDFDSIVRETIKEIGYIDNKGFSYDTCEVYVYLDRQSEDIRRGVDLCYDGYNSIGAGDQGIMYGYACDDNDAYMPLSILLAHRLAERLSYVRKSGIVKGLGPDGKTQVTLKYCDETDRVLNIDSILVSSQHDEELSLEELKGLIKSHVVEYVLNDMYIHVDWDETELLVNPTGRFVEGGPGADAGLTGRKIIVDTYGGVSRHGGGAFSGKDGTKVDRSGAYMARYVAKNIVAAGLADECEVGVSYAIGVSEPTSIYINTFYTSDYTDSEIREVVEQVFDFRPASIIDQFQLRSPIYKDLSSYGHFGRVDVPWERLDKVDEIREIVSKL